MRMGKIPIYISRSTDRGIDEKIGFVETGIRKGKFETRFMEVKIKFIWGSVDTFEIGVK